MKCQKCGKEMIKRNGKNGPFMGCSGYPNCRNIVSISKNSPFEKKELKRIKIPSDYQVAIFDWVKNGKGNAVVKATAGSGKTTVEEHCIAILMEDMQVPSEDIVYLAFNSHIVKEAVERGLPAKTTHQIGLSIITQYTCKKVKVDDNKVGQIVKSLINNSYEDDKWMISPVCQIVGKLKNTLAPTDDQTLEKICSKFGIEVNGSSEKIFDLVRQALTESNNMLDVIDFNDMIYLPVKMKMDARQYKYILADETQDFNRAQIELLKKLLSPDGRLLAVGDENQSLYGFRGAAPDAMQNIIEAFKAEILPLSISYRNPTSHVDLINKIFPEIRHEKSPYAKEGKVLSMSYDKMLGSVLDGDLVLCRTNAPLVEPVFTLIRMGIKAIIRGRDIGQNLISLVERFNVKDVCGLLDKLQEYRAKEVTKLLKGEKTNQAQSLEDKIETIFALSEGCEQTWEIVQKINEVFSDKKEGVIFSTVHRAKGDEANNVYILKPHLMPHPMAKNEEDMIQEKNCLFVALTRSKDTLVFVGGPIPTSFEAKMEEEVIKEISKILPEGTKIYADVEIYENGKVSFNKEIEVSKEKPIIENCPF